MPWLYCPLQQEEQRGETLVRVSPLISLGVQETWWRAGCHTKFKNIQLCRNPSHWLGVVVAGRPVEEFEFWWHSYMVDQSTLGQQRSVRQPGALYVDAWRKNSPNVPSPLQVLLGSNWLGGLLYHREAAAGELVVTKGKYMKGNLVAPCSQNFRRAMWWGILAGKGFTPSSELATCSLTWL